MSNLTVPDTAEAECRALIDSALRHAAAHGATQAEVHASKDLGLTVTARMRDVETIEFSNDRGFGITVYVGKQKGSASTADFRPEAVATTVDKALAIARQATEDPFSGLADETRMAVDLPDLSLHHPWDIDADRARELALETEAAALDTDPRITNSEGATVTTHSGLSVYGNSHGFVAATRRSRHTISCAVIADQGTGMERDYDYSTARNAARLQAPEHVGRRAAEKALRRLGARKLSTRVAPAIFAADVARGFVGHLLSAISGGAQYRRASFLLEAAGEKVFPDFVTISERPYLPEAFGSAAYDSEGVQTVERDLIDGGVLTGYLLSSYSARRLGAETTGNAGGVHNVIVESHGGGLDQLLRDMGDGLLITELMGQGVNPVTGDYSRGAAGFWVSGGEIAHPVSEITVAGNLRTLYAGIKAIGSDVDRRGVVQSGSILVDRLTIAGD